MAAAGGGCSRRAVSTVVTWWLGPVNALNADAFQVNRFDITGIAPTGYAVFAMALGICAGTVLRRTLPTLAITLAGFAGLRALTALRLHYMAPVAVVLQTDRPFHPGRVLPGNQPGWIGPNGQPPVPSPGNYGFDGEAVPAVCEKFMSGFNPNPRPCLMAHSYQEYVTYQPASRFWAF